MLIRISVLLAALLGLLSSPALADVDSSDPERLARHCVMMINARADRAVAVIAETTQTTIQRIRRLDAAGASDREIIAAGAAGVSRIGHVARSTIGGIQTITRRCVHALERLGAGRELIGRVLSASEAAQASVAGAAERGTHAIRQAVREAIG